MSFVDMVIDDIDQEDDELQIAKPYVITVERGTGEVLAIDVTGTLTILWHSASTFCA